MSGAEAAPVTPNVAAVEDKTPRVFFDSYAARSPRRSISSSRYSGRMSRRSSVRDDVHTRDEFERKQRIVRYMEEERERAERSKLQREEHDTWVEFRAQERAERLQFMTEQEIAELLRREADEALRERSLAEAASRRAAEDALHRRQSIAELRKDLESAAAVTAGRPAVVGMQYAEPASAGGQQQSQQQQSAQYIDMPVSVATEAAAAASAHSEPPATEAANTVAAVAVADTQVADLQATIRQLREAVAEAKADAVAARQSAEVAQQAADAAEQRRALDAAAVQESKRQLEEQRTELAALHTRLAGSEVSNQRLLAAAQEKDTAVAQLTRQLDEQVAETQRVKLERTQMKEKAEPSNGSEDGSVSAVAEQTRARVEMQKELAVAKAQADARKRELDELQKRCRELERRSAEQAHKAVAATQESVRLQAELRRAQTAAEATRSLHEEQIRSAVAARSARDARRIAELERLQEEMRKNRDDYKVALEQLSQQPRDAVMQADGSAAPIGAAASDEKAAALRAGSARPATTEALQRTRAELAMCRRQLVDCQRDLQQLRERHTRQVDRLRRRLAAHSAQSPSQPSAAASSTVSSRRSASFLSDGHTHQTIHSSQSALRVQGAPHMERVREMQQEIRSLRLQLKDSAQREQQAVSEARRVRDAAPQSVAAVPTAEQAELTARVAQLQSENDVLRQQNAVLTEKLAVAAPPVRPGLELAAGQEGPWSIQKIPPSPSIAAETKDGVEVHTATAEQLAPPDMLDEAQHAPTPPSAAVAATVSGEEGREVPVGQAAPDAPLPLQARPVADGSSETALPAAEHGDSAVAAAAFFDNYTTPKVETPETVLRDAPAVTNVVSTQPALEATPIALAAPPPQQQPLTTSAVPPPQLDNPGRSFVAPQQAVHAKTKRSCHCC